MSATDAGRLHFVEGMNNVAKYIATFETRMLPSAKEMYPADAFVFQDNNVAYNRAKVLQNWFASRDIILLQLPGQYPDLNSPENLWHKVRYKISEKEAFNQKGAY